jgi:hypothetical protein
MADRSRLSKLACALRTMCPKRIGGSAIPTEVWPTEASFDRSRAVKRDAATKAGHAHRLDFGCERGYVPAGRGAVDCRRDTKRSSVRRENAGAPVDDEPEGNEGEHESQPPLPGRAHHLQAEQRQSQPERRLQGDRS